MAATADGYMQQEAGASIVPEIQDWLKIAKKSMQEDDPQFLAWIEAKKKYTF